MPRDTSSAKYSVNHHRFRGGLLDCRQAAAPHRQPAQLGLRTVLPVPAQRQRLWLEPQAGLPDLSGAGTQSANKTQEAVGACQTGAVGSPRPAQSVLVDGLHA